MMNNWADVFPPRRSPNLALTERGFILRRARQCQAQRHHIPNLILTDFYDSGDVVGSRAHPQRARRPSARADRRTRTRRTVSEPPGFADR